MCIYILFKTETLTLSAPFRTLGREYVGTLPSLFQGVPGAREGRPAHGHVRASRPRGERVRGRRQALGHRDGSRRRQKRNAPAGFHGGGGAGPGPLPAADQASGGRKTRRAALDGRDAARRHPFLDENRAVLVGWRALLRVVDFQSLLSSQPVVASALEKAQHAGGTKSPEARSLREGYYLLAKVLWTRRASIQRIHDLAWLDHTVVSAGARLRRVLGDGQGSRSIRAPEEALSPGGGPELFPLEGSRLIDVPAQAFAGVSPTVKLQRGVSQPYRVGIVPEPRLRPWYEAVTTAKFSAPPAAVSVLGEIEALIAAARRAGGPSVALVFAASSFEDRFAE